MSARKDPVTSEVREAVFARDAKATGYRGWGPLCVAPSLDGTAGYCEGYTTLDHVKDQPRMGVRAPSDMGHLVSLCHRHHLETGWATSHRPELRGYLRDVS